MLVKQVQKAVVSAWSPANQHPTLLAAGSAAQQLDESFNTSATLEIYDLALSQTGIDMPTVASVNSEHRFHKIVWGSYGMNGEHKNGLIIGGCDDGHLQVYSASKLLAKQDGLVAHPDKHTGAVRSLDFNPFQSNLLATGASDSEIYIWDLNNTNTPMTPGTKSQPLESVQWISWNKQVQHILASTFSSRCVVWDLRKNEPIIKLTDSNGRVRWRVVAWHPEIATQLCLASEDDQVPIIQLWDLRFATAPLKVLENHTRGVLTVAWCSQDPDLLISCGKDNRILCWNPNSNVPNGEVLSEISHSNQWSYDISWCPRNPALIAGCSSDGRLSVYSLMGGTTQAQATQQSATHLAESFPGMDGYMQQPAPQTQMPDTSSTHLTKPPKWLRRPCGASFGFGGKLIIFENDKNAAQNGVRSVQVKQVVTNPELLERSKQFENALENENYVDYCRSRADSTESQHQRYIWYFLKSYFEPNPRSELLNLLGFRADDMYARLNKYIGKPANAGNDVDVITNQIAGLNRGISSESEGDQILSSDTSAELSPATLDGSAAFEAISSGQISANLDRSKYLNTPFDITTGDDNDGLITLALLTGNIEAAVELCFEADRMADALILAMSGGSDLLARTQNRYLQRNSSKGGRLAPLISALVTEDWSSVITNCKPSSWREALAAVLTHTPDKDLPLLCQKLGEHLETSDPSLQLDAQLCYICAGSIENIVASWKLKDNKHGNHKADEEKEIKALQELIEVVMLLKKAVEFQGRHIQISGKLADLLVRYASLLLSQGNLSAALMYLGSSQDQQIVDLKNRILYATGQQSYRSQRSYSQSKQNILYPGPQPGYNTGAPNSFYNNQPPLGSYNQPIGGQPNASKTAWQQPLSRKPSLPTSQAPSANPIGFVQPPTTFSPAPPNAPVARPPRPSSVSSTHGGSGLSRKYVLDPSVQNNSGYGSSLSYGTSPMVPSSMPMNPALPPNSFQYSSPISQHNQFGVPNPMPPQPSSTPLGPVSPPMNISSTPANPLMPPMPPTSNQSNYPVNSQPMPGFGSLPPTRPPAAQNAPAPPLSTSAQHQYASGWNDPPMITRAPKNQAKHEYTHQNPITQPLVDWAPEANGFTDPMMPVGGPYLQQSGMPGQGNLPPVDYQQFGPQSQQPPLPPQQQFGVNPSFPPANGFRNSVQSFEIQGHQQQQQSHNQSPAVAKIAEPEKPKGPIPEEHIHLKTVFDELRNQCTNAASNPQMKRKLDDVGKKLEALYDLLRENKLAANTLSQLHQIVQMIQVGDYHGCLGVHTQLVSGSDFAQIASFMPGLKVLLQSAIHLQVYVR